MTAGGGIIHSEEPSDRIREKGGKVHGFQVWLNLPARLKMTQPRYQEVPSARIPEGRTADGHARVKVIAGSAVGVAAVIDTHLPITFQDWSLDEQGDARVTVAEGSSALAYVFGGKVRLGDEGKEVADGQMAILTGEGEVRLRGVAGSGSTARVLLLAGQPLREPLARYGPFVMNTEQEIRQAIVDFQSGRMGEIVRTAKVG